MLLTLGAAIVVLGLLIFVHELGHFMAAKAVGIGVPRFSIGLGPATPLSFRRGETEYVISWVPFGGYVKMASAEDGEGTEALEGGRSRETFPREKLFEHKPLWARITVILAGVTMNALFAWLVYVVIAVGYGRAEEPTTTIARFDAETLPPAAAALADVPFGTKILRVNGDTVASFNDIFERLQDITSERLRFDFSAPQDPIILPISGLQSSDRAAILSSIELHWEARIGQVNPGSAADRAGLAAGDLVVGIGGDTVRTWTEMVDVVRGSAGVELPIEVLRGAEVVSTVVVPDARTERDPETGEDQVIGQLGVFREITARRVRFGLGEATLEGTRRVGQDARNIWFAVTQLVTGGLSPRELGGPLQIGMLAGQTARAGLETFLSFMAFFSVNLAILNMLPIPVLDGGQFMFLLLEGVRGKPLSLEFRMRLTQFGLVILLGIMAWALTNDLLGVFGR